MTWREARCVAAIGVGFLLTVFVLSHPGAAALTSFPLAIPDPFRDVPLLKPGALPAVLAVSSLVLVLGVWKLPALVRRPRSAVCAVFLFGVCLHVALIASLTDGLPAMQKRAITSFHGEFLLQAVSVEDLHATLNDYEPYVHQYVYLANKGPGVLVLFRGLNTVANSAPMRAVLEGAAPGALTLRWWLAERGVELTKPQLEQLRHLLALLLVLFPLLTFLPVFLMFWVGRTLVDDTLGLLAAQLYTLVPATALLVAHLDFALFPLATMGIIAPFVVGIHQKRPVLVAVSAAVFVAYFTVTLAAVSVLIFLAAYMGIGVVRRLRRRETFTAVARDLSWIAGVYALVSIVLLVIVCVWMPFDPFTRYSYARALQRDWVTSEYGLFWMTADVLGYFVSFGLMQTALLLLQQGHVIRRTWVGSEDATDHIALAWLCLLLALVAFARQHGETNRMWTFLTPVACLIVAKYLYERLSPRRLWVPLAAALVLLFVARYHLSYF